LTAINEIRWPSGAYRWLDSEFPPPDAAAAESALKSAGATVWVGYGPAGWPAHPWAKEGFEAVLEGGGKAVALAVGPLAPTGGSAWTLGANLAHDLLNFLGNWGLLGKVAPGIDVEAQLAERNLGFAVDMAAEFLATMKAAGQSAVVYGPWGFQTELHSTHPGLLEWAWGTGNAAANEALGSPPGLPADAAPDHRADQFAWDVDVEGANCDLSVSQFEPEPSPAKAEPAPAEPAPAEPAPAEPAPAEPAPATANGSGVTERAETGVFQSAVTVGDGETLELEPGAGVAAWIIDAATGGRYDGPLTISIGEAGAYLIFTTAATVWKTGPK